MIGLLIALLRVYELLIVVRALMSWFGVGKQHPLIEFVKRATEPVIDPLGKLAVFGRVDFSPVIAILLIELFISWLGG